VIRVCGSAAESTDETVDDVVWTALQRAMGPAAVKGLTNCIASEAK
jgi:hypothetical protein